MSEFAAFLDAVDINLINLCGVDVSPGDNAMVVYPCWL